MTRLLRTLLVAALRLWPSRDRRRLAADLVETAEARARDAAARAGRLIGWRTWGDEILSALAEAWRLRAWRRAATSKPAGDAILAGWRGDVVRALRLAGQRPVAFAGLTITMAAVIAATTTALGVATAVLWRPLPYPSAERLIFLWEAAGEDDGPFRVSRATYESWKRQASSVEALAAFGASGVALELPGGSTPFRGVRVSPEFFATLGVSPLLGRTFTPGEPATVDEIVLSARAWRARFGAAPDIVGRTIRLSGAPYTVVGVLPDMVLPGWPTNPAHVGIDASEREYWIRMPAPAQNLRSHLLGVVARLRPGASSAQAVAELSAAAVAGDGHAALATPFRDQFVAAARTPLLAVVAAVVALLLAAVANLAALHAAASEPRRLEFGIRAALGAGRLRLVRAVVVEAALHVVAGLLLGLPLAAIVLARLPEALPPSMPFVTAPALDGRVLTVAVLVGVVATALMAAWPARRVGAAPSRTSRAVVGGRTYRGLVVLQVALGVAAAIPAILLARSLAAVLDRDAGFTLADVVVVDVAIPGPAPGVNPSMTRVTTVEADVRAALSARPDVRGVAFAYDHPLESNWSDVVSLPSRASVSEEQQVQLRIVSPSYFSALDVALVDGRVFTEADTADRPGLAVINQALADRLGSQALGVRVSQGGPRFAWGPAVPDAFTIVGVVENERFRGLEADVAPALYLSTAQFPMAEVSVLVKAAPGRADAVAADLPGVVRRAAVDASIGRTRLLTSLRDGQLASRRLTTEAVTGFAAATVALAMLGVHGVLAGVVVARRREVGVRLALGEPPGLVARRVAADGLVTVGLGLVVGLAGAAASGRLVSHVLVGVTASDPTIAVAVAGAMLVAALVAALGPAWRAAHVDPAEVLRAE